VLVLKNRQNELKAMSKILDKNLYPNDLIPLIEIISEAKKYDKKIDPVTGKFVTNPRRTSTGKLRHYKIDDPDTERDVTLRNLSELFTNHPVFIEYFRGNLSLYDGYDAEKNHLVLELNNNLEEYKNKTFEIVKHGNLIPVIAIKNGIDKFVPEELSSFIEEIKTRKHGRPIAVRINEIDGYEEIIEESLTSQDYLLFDISQQPVDSKETEYDELMGLAIRAQVILLCSPRKREIDIKDYEHNTYTLQIDNRGIDLFEKYGFTGYGDYGGLKDSLPTRSFGNRNHPGRALALLFNSQKRAFKSYVCDDSTLGLTGYQQLYEPIFQDREELDPDENCIVYKELEDKIERNVNCTYQDWIQYTLMRYIQQIRQNEYNA
jgi:hypothetical protein